jgi:hypothetical protein
MKESSGIDMVTVRKELDFEKLPTLSDLLCVEEAIQDSNESIVSPSQLKKLLQGKITQNTLRSILGYLDEKNKIATSSKGVTWIKHKKKLLDFMDELLKNSELTEEDAIRLGRKVNKKVAKRFFNDQEEDNTKKKETKSKTTKKINVEKLAQKSKLTKEDVDAFNKKIKASATKRFLS